MINIVKHDSEGNVTSKMTVARGAFNEFFKPVGWTLEGEEVQVVVPVEVEIPKGKVTDDLDADVKDDKSDDDAYTPDTDESVPAEAGVEDDTDLLEKPISDMSSAEIKKFAKLKGIDLTGCTSKSDAKAKVKEALNQ